MTQQLDTRTRLIEATIDAINVGGEASVRVHNVAEIAEVREPSVYHFFKNRKELVDVAQAERYRRSYIEMFLPFRAMVEMATNAQEFENALRQLFAAVARIERYEARATRINVWGSAQSSKHLAEVVNQVNEEVSGQFGALIAECQQKGWVRKDLDPTMLGLWAMGQINARNMVELNSEKFDLAAWDQVSIESILATFKPT
jgi:AcrR family transcriptional regulator